VLGVEATLVSNAGHSADLSGPVLTRALCHFDNAYWLPHVQLHGFAAKTNTQSNTAFRGFGGPQGALAVELLMDRIARELGTRPAGVRRPTTTRRGPRPRPTASRSRTSSCTDLIQAWKRAATTAARRAEVDGLQRRSPVLKKGLALTPVKFGISFNVVHLNQAGSAGAHLHRRFGAGEPRRHRDGPGPEHQGGEVVAHELGTALERVRCSATDTQQDRQHQATAASTGADLNGKAAQAAARTLRERLAQAGRAAKWAARPTTVLFADGLVAAERPDPASPSWCTRPTTPACSSGATASTPRRA
jgi:xanthine dehydrogenase large subunit